MEKEQIISLIKQNLGSGKISKNDLLNLANDNQTADLNLGQNMANPEVSGENFHSSALVKIFYVIGAVIALVGVVILIVQNWNEIGFLGRIVVTLGIAIISYIFAVLMRDQKRRFLSQVLFIISFVLSPIGVLVLLYETKIDFDLVVQLLFSLVMLVIYGLAYYVTKRNVLILILVAFATWAYYAFILEFLDNSFNNILQWATIIIGFAYIFLAYSRRALKIVDIHDVKEQRSVSGLLYGVGTIAVLGASMAIGGIFDLLVILFIFGAFYGSVFLKSRIMLVVASFFLVGHMIKITLEYFGNSLGWPILLVLIGFLIIGIGYLTFYLNKKYISS